MLRHQAFGALLTALLLALWGCENGNVTPGETQDIGRTEDSGGEQDLEPEGECVDEDGDGFFVGDGCREGSVLDCDDTSGTTYPNAEEICGNGLDEDCDGEDELCEDPCVDLDNDGFLGLTDECTKGDDCDDADKDIHPDADEICGNEVDEDCDGEDAECPPECVDLDSDGYIAQTAECPQGTDCDDADKDIHPDAVELCGNQVDEDCDGNDEECPPECDDNDGDGYGNGADCIDYDCNDGNPDVHPGAVEICENGLDDDCVDGDDACPETCDDNDEDGFGVGGACVVQDCDDNNNTIHPDAEEICGNDVDENCDGLDMPCCEDNDGDGYGTGECDGPDCDDSNPDVYPGATEICGNGLDDDCVDGDEECTLDCDDGDNDGYGDGVDCIDTDCDDTDPEIFPGAQEICGNGVDEDCNGADAECPPPDCVTDWDCDDVSMLCDQSSGTCRYAKVWEWYAPTFYVDTDTDGEGLDLIRAVDFDGDWKAANNAGNVGKGSKAAVVYYSFVKTSTHWYLGYFVYFPKRWTTWPLGTKYENTMRGVLVVVEQDGTQYGNPVLVETVTEDTFFQYAPDGTPLWGNASVDGEINWDLDVPTDHHPVVYVHSQDHGIWGDAYLWNNVSNWDVNGFPGGDGVVYRFGNKAETPVNDNDEVYYVLAAVNDTLWPRREEIGTNQLFDEFGHFDYADDTSTRSVAPWRIWDTNFPSHPKGEMLYDPADLVRRHFPYGWGGFSFVYAYNPYALKVTIEDLMLYVTADPFNAAADPFINLFLMDGSGSEIKVLSNFYGLQKSWYAKNVDPNVLLDMAVELEGRNYFYGLIVPGKSYFGIEVKDYDDGLTFDDWLMDDEETHYYDFVGTELKDWGKSDSYITVEVP